METLTFGTFVISFLAALATGTIGGAVGGMVVGGEHLGKDLASLLGGFYGLTAVVPGVFTGLVLLALVG